MNMELKSNRSDDTRMKNQMNTLLLHGFAMLGAALLCIPATSGYAVIINVTSTADSGTGTLRAALAGAANGDIIDATSVSGTVVLTSGELLVTKSITMLGPGPGNLAVNGNYPNTTNRVFYIKPGLVVTITGLTITNSSAFDTFSGGAGGGILNDRSTLTVSNCVFSGNRSGNTAGGIYNNAYEDGSATLLVSSCTFSNNSADYGGGAIDNEGGSGSAAVWISSSTFSGNSAGFYGGAIYNAAVNFTNAMLVVSNCTFGSNSSGSGAGGAIANFDLGTTTAINSAFSNNVAGSGGALYNAAISGNATLTVNNSTISGNSAANGGGGIYNTSFDGLATTRVLNSTISGNSILAPNGQGGAIYNDGSYSTNSPLVVVLNCTMSGNSSPSAGGIYNNAISGRATLNIGSTILKKGASGANILNDAGTVTSLGYNLSSDNGGGLLTASTDQINTDAKLGPLQNNGGPTFTHALSLDSPALDKGKNLAGSPTDQRGLARIVDLCAANAVGGDGSDIGAVELSVTIPTGTLTVLNTNDSGAGSLREAILFANVCPDTNTIVFAPSAYGKITLTSGQLPITAPLSILGPGPTNVVISGNKVTTVFYIGPNLNITIAGLTIADGTNAVNGGGIYNDHSILTLSNCTLSSNAAFFGGGIYNDGGSGSATLSLSACTFTRNLARDSGGAIYNGAEAGNATLKVLNTTFSTNSAPYGGGIYNDGFYGSAALSVNACTFSGNSATSWGGSVYNIGFNGTSTVQIGDTILSAGASGATLQNDGGSISSFGYNLSSDNGGGFLTGIADQINTDPKLGPLQNNGGPTFTHALLPGSPAIDKGKRDAIASLAANSDQRGFLRPVDSSSIPNASGGDGSDIGAFEAQLAATVGTPMLLAGPQKLLNGSFQFSFTNTPGASFSVLTTTNVALPLSNWTVLGTPIEISPGYFQYADLQATNQPRRFYGVRSP
jgi:predicted outer membrane repeat protein